jgi:hypothetical protein
MASKFTKQKMDQSKQTVEDPASKWNEPSDLIVSFFAADKDRSSKFLVSDSSCKEHAMCQVVGPGRDDRYEERQTRRFAF